MEILNDIISLIVFIQVPAFGVMLAAIIYQVEYVSLSSIHSIGHF